MKYLFINSATSNLIVAIIIDGKIAYNYNENIGNDTSSRIMPVIEKAFNKTNITPKSIDKIFVTIGPGSFTGIRVGLTVAKVWAYSQNIPVIELSSLEVMASGYNQNTTPLIDARRGYVYIGTYDKDLNVIKKDQYTILDYKQIENPVSYDKFSFDVKEPKIDLLKIIKKHQNDKPKNIHHINPNYLKLTEAEEKRLNDQTNK